MGRPCGVHDISSTHGRTLHRSDGENALGISRCPGLAGPMPKSYLFECEKCGYRSVITGGSAAGNDVKVRTMICKECRALYDCVVALRTTQKVQPWKQFEQVPREIAPSVASAVARLPTSTTAPRQWREFVPTCPTEATHRVEPWGSPGRCPRCRAYMERGALPYRIWD